ncbi:Uncharacterised protein [Staphylococcus aureus]|nr:Uncharacterised protein [Staphylococcus aureus]SCU53392.1 Uncharacterised protein [Staphylococcus aureus]
MLKGTEFPSKAPLIPNKLWFGDLAKALRPESDSKIAWAIMTDA